METGMALEEIKVLDHGYVKLVETWGSDASFIEAARMSTNKGFNGWGDEQDCTYGPENWVKCKLGRNGCTSKHVGDEKLLSYLYKNKHMTPFEMGGLIIEVQAPIFVFREWHRHRTQSYNEMSARYIPLPDVNYQPTLERCLMSGGTNKQAQGLVEPEAHEIEEWLAETERLYALLETHYQSGLKHGVPKEVARIVLPVGRYSRMRASANLRNWLGFLALRLDAGAQWEIRQYAEAVATLVSAAFPRTYELFSEN